MDVRSYCIDFERIDEWKNYLNNEGFVVITNICTLDNCEKAKQLFIEHFGMGDKIFNDTNWPKGQNGMIVEGDIHQSNFVNFAKTLPRVLMTYRHLYEGEEEFVTAFDRANAIRNGPNDNNEKPWLHIDFPVFDPPPFTCYQSFVNFVDCTPSDSPCLRVVPRSHKGDLWASVSADIKKRKSPENRSAFFRVKMSEKDVVNVLAPAGSLVVWICGLVHDARTKLSKKKAGWGEFRRLNVYVCMAPRRYLRGEEEEKQRQLAFYKGLVSTHWPCWFFQHHGYQIQTTSRYTDKKPFDAKATLLAFPDLEKLI